MIDRFVYNPATTKGGAGPLVGQRGDARRRGRRDAFRGGDDLQQLRLNLTVDVIAEAEADAGRGVVRVHSARPRRFERTPTMTKERKTIRAKAGLLE